MKQLFTLMVLVFVLSTHAQTDQKFKTIMLRSTGEVETLPDMATFRINLNCLKATVKNAKTCLVEKSNALTARLLELGIDKDDVLTTSVTLNKSYTWSNNTRIFEGYKSATALRVTVKDIDALDEIYTELLENRNLDLGGLSYSHTEMESLKNKAYVNALTKANTLADQLLAELPEDKKEVLKIGNVHIAASTPRQAASELAIMSMDSGMRAKEESVSINTGTIKISATLYVEYQIE